MKKCEDIRELVSMYVEGELTGDLLAEFEAHIESCDDCRRELQDVRTVLELLKNAPEEDLPVDFKTKLHDKLISERENSKKTLSRILVKYSPVFASAAGFLVLLCIWVFYNANFKTDMKTSEKLRSSMSSEDKSADYGSYSDGSDSDSNSNSIVNGTGKSTGNQIGQTPELDSQAAKNKSNANAGGLNSENPEIAFSNNAKSIMAFDSKTADDSKNTPSKDSKVNAKTAPDLKMALSAVGTMAPNIYKSTDIVLTTSNPEEQKAKIESIAIVLGGEEYVIPKVEITSSVPADNAISPRAKSAEDQKDYSEVCIKVPEQQYDIFLKKVKENFGEANIKTGEMISSDTTASQNQIKENISEIDNKLKDNEAKNVTGNSAETEGLINQKNQLNNELTDMQKNSGYIIVTIKLEKK